MESDNRTGIARGALVGGLMVFAMLVLSTVWMGRAASRETASSVHSVSLLFLDELADRRGQVVASNLRRSINDIHIALELMSEEDLSDVEHLQEYQKRMKRIYGLEKFAFVDEDGVIYTSKGLQYNIDDYEFDYDTPAESDVSLLEVTGDDGTVEKKVVIAVPSDTAFDEDDSPTPITLGGKTLKVCFMEKSMSEMLIGVSMTPKDDDVTYCNMYTRSGTPLNNTVLGGMAQDETTIIEAMEHAEYDEGYSYETFVQEFSQGQSGQVGFGLQGVKATMSYVPVEGTDWMLTYLIYDSKITEQLSTVSNDVISRSVIQSMLTVVSLALIAAYLLQQTRRHADQLLEKETVNAAIRARHEELQQRLQLNYQLLEQERLRKHQDELITALSSDYRSVYYVNLDTDEGVCHQARNDLHGLAVGERFSFAETMRRYCEEHVSATYQEEFLRFVQPDNIRRELSQNLVISCSYLASIEGRESYEQVRFAGVRHPEDRDDHIVHNVGACFVDVDSETRSQIMANEALSSALDAAEKASHAKTVFLSSMSHEIRNPMNAIIGLDSIALNDPETPPQTREYLEKINGSAEHLLSLINDILDMSRIESGQLTLRNEEFSFPKLIDSINTMFSGQCEERHLEFQCQVEGPVDDYYIGDSTKLRQVLINILGNAVKFTPEGGTVSLKVRRMAQFDNRTTLRFTIADTGIGMSEDFLPHLFDAFSQEDSSTTSRYGSSGLGLAITKSFVEMMNGTIEVSSKKGEGSTFVVTVTLADDTRSKVPEEDEIHPDSMNVLVIDDDDVACKHAKLVLEKAGIAAETATSGEEAIEMVRLRHARRDPYNLILVDWKMPGMDGVETTRVIRQIEGNELAIVILTAYRWDDVLEEALTAGVDSFISKPLSATAVIEEFKLALRRKEQVELEQAKQAVDLAGRRILLAEDMEINAEIMIMVLEMRDMEVELAVNGRVALEMFEASDVGYYDAVLMDMRMPEMDGLEATRAIRALDREDAKKVPIVALTANAFDEDVQNSLQAGLNAHLSKPVQPEVLFETLEGLIRDE